MQGNSPNGRTRSKSSSSPSGNRFKSLNGISGGGRLQFETYSDDGSDAGGAYYSLLSDIGGIPMKTQQRRSNSPYANGNGAAGNGGGGMAGDHKYGTMISDGSSTDNDTHAHHQMHWLTLQFVDRYSHPFERFRLLADYHAAVDTLMDDYLSNSDIEQTFVMQHADKCVAHDRAFFIVVAIAAILV